MFLRALEWFLLTNRDSCVALYLGQCIREGLRAVTSGSSVHSVGRAEPTLFPTSSWFNLSLFTLQQTPSDHLTQPASCLFSCSCLWPEAWWTDGRQSKDFQSYTDNSSMLSNLYLPNKKHVTVSHQEVSSALQDSEGKHLSVLSV